ncbi:MAG: ribose-phosphate diphosphokinase [Beijerinckiaceae bacterium]|nr:ribose-phosphate diphosphokinase [Beijerinckiaceae bacterium]MCZ8300415.1 ribose-phosphate diphosphokinase [Beijerinckiaceae bacterium]
MSDAILLAFSDDQGPASALARRLGLPCAEIMMHRFPDGEICPRVPASATTTLIYRSFDQPNEKLLALLLAHDALARDPRVKRVELVAPYLPYLRQDIAFHPGEPVSQAVLCRLLAERFTRIITVDPHLHRTADLGSTYPGTVWQVLSAQDVIADAIAAGGTPSGLVIIGPDIESTPLVERLATRLGCSSGTFAKERKGDRQVHLTAPVGLDVAGRPVLILDDMCSTGGTLARLAIALQSAGAGSVEAIVTHALFDDVSATRMREAGIARIRSTDSVQHPSNAFLLAGLLAEAIASPSTRGCS